jgi:hypothetical protein
MKTRLLTTLGFISMLAACTHRTAVVPRPEPASDTATTKVSPVASPQTHTTHWDFNPQHSRNSYRSHTESGVVSLEGSNRRSDSAQIMTEFTLNIDQLDSLTSFSGEITKVFPTIIQKESPTLPIPFSATITRGHFTLGLIAAQPPDELCNSKASQILGEIRSVINDRPASLSIGTTWSDTTSTTTCSGNRLPTRLHIIRFYQVVGQSEYKGRPMLTINRTDTTQLAGEGSQEQHQLKLEGSSVGRAKILVDSRSGTTNFIEITQELQITVTSSGRVTHFHQDIRQSTELIY